MSTQGILTTAPVVTVTNPGRSPHDHSPDRRPVEAESGVVSPRYG